MLCIIINLFFICCAHFLLFLKKRYLRRTTVLPLEQPCVCVPQEKFLGTNSFALAFKLASVAVAALTVFLILAGDAAAASPLLFLVKAFA
mmetsp:Transcript_4579/g.6764  ORF Transcript_4579/g.6764 Transcript_4579/m.6764 type:complete len:90 (-) Transcript_4579:952-1221(-)